MLSRVADSLYWMSRYVERAENVTRVLTVNFNALLDAPSNDDAARWRPIVELSGDGALFFESFGQRYTTDNVIEFMLWHSANPNAVLSCITRARENARSVREQISSEMWENVNKLYFELRGLNKDALARGPHALFASVRNGSHAFQGVTHATMTHGEAYEFIQLGKHLERAITTIRIVDGKYNAVNALPAGTAEASVELIAMLKSCSAFEAFRKSPGSNLQAADVAEYLLLNQDFPRAARFSLKQCLGSVNEISGGQGRPSNAPQRALGKLNADLEFLDINDILGPVMHVYLDGLLANVHDIGDAITRAYFNTQVIMPAPRSAQQSQQQQ